MTYPIDTVSRPYGYKKKQKQTQKADVEAKNTNKKNLKQSAIFAKRDRLSTTEPAERSSGLGMKGSKLLTRQRKWQLAHPEARRAHELVKAALRRGTLAKDCGTDQHVDAHHEDYSKPLVVTWLCRRHHAARHRRKIVKGPKS